MDREEILSSLRGQNLHIPDFQALLSHWPQYVSPELGRLRTECDEKYQELFPDSERIGKMKAANLDLFTASWWPYAPFEQLRIVAFLSIWLFAWDDECDSAEYSSLISDYDRAKAFRAQTIDYVQRCLIPNGHDGESKPPSNRIIASFRPVGDAILESCTPAQIKCLLKEVIFFIEMSGVEHQVQMENGLPSVEDYNERRMGSSAVRVCLAVTEYCLGITIPPQVMSDDAMQTIWHETNIIVSTMNDVLSFRKEIMQSQVDTLIPILYTQHGTLEGAVAEALEMIHISIANFEVAAQQLLERYHSNKELHSNLQKWLHACRCACTSNLNWSLGSGRYKLGAQSLSGGLTVSLQ